LVPGLAAFECPKKPAAGDIVAETALDCPWAGTARELSEKAGKGEALGPVFSAYAPGIVKQLAADRADPAVKQLWGESINFDEMENDVIVLPALLSFMASELGVAQPKGKYVHAGMEHTYGYLFSLLETKFGFKRARWVNDDIAGGLGIPDGLVGPASAEGTLLSNITCMAGGIALKDDAAAAGLLKNLRCPAALRKYIAAKIPRFRLTETVVLPGSRTVVLRTDFVPFNKTSAGGNSHLLIYSVYDSAYKKASLITAFPVARSFMQNAADPKGLGAGKPVQTRYNAWVEGLTGGKVKGLRAASWLDR